MKVDRVPLWTALGVAAVIGAVLLTLGLQPPASESASATVDQGTQPAGAARDEIAWGHSLADGLKQAAEQKKPLMVDFYTDWCGWCKRLDEETYRDSKVVAKAKEFVAVKVNAEQDSDSAAKYSVDGFPTIVFLNSSGKEIHRVAGFAPPSDFLKQMDAALSEAAKK
jgi:thiol:disulfide interchange protein